MSSAMKDWLQFSRKAPGVELAKKPNRSQRPSEQSAHQDHSLLPWTAGGLLLSMEPRALLRPERTLRTCASSSGTSPPMMAQSASPLATALQARRDCSTIRCTATCAGMHA